MTQLLKKPIIPLLILLALVAAVLFLSRTKIYNTAGIIGARADSAGDNVRDVRADTPTVEAWEVYSTDNGSTAWFSGTVNYEKERPLSFRTSGTVKDLYIREGTRLWAEKVLASLDEREKEDGVRQTTKAFEKARYEAMKAASNYERLRVSLKTNPAATQEVSVAGQALLKAQQVERTARKQLQTAELNLGYCDIIMAEKGFITALHVKEGDKVEAGQAIAGFRSNYPVQITIMAPAIFMTQIVQDSKARVRVKGGDRSYVANVQSIGTATTGPGARYPIKLIFAKTGSFESGMEAEGSFRVEGKIKGKHMLILPDMLATDGQGDYVYIVKPADGPYGTIERRTVTTGMVTAFGQEITSGLSDGDVVVFKNQNRLQNGMKVRWK